MRVHLELLTRMHRLANLHVATIHDVDALQTGLVWVDLFDGRNYFSACAILLLVRRLL